MLGRKNKLTKENLERIISWGDYAYEKKGSRWDKYDRNLYFKLVSIFNKHIT
jgi:hypothetical protein